MQQISLKLTTLYFLIVIALLFISSYMHYMCPACKSNLINSIIVKINPRLIIIISFDFANFSLLFKEAKRSLKFEF
jgi:hypothetical protein